MGAENTVSTRPSGGMAPYPGTPGPPISSDVCHGTVGLDRPRRAGVPSGQSSLALTTEGGPMGSTRDSLPDPRRAGSAICPPLFAHSCLRPFSANASIRHSSSGSLRPQPTAIAKHATCHAPPSLRHASVGRRVRHPDHAGAPRSQGREDNDDLHPCAESRGQGGPQPRGHLAIMTPGSGCYADSVYNAERFAHASVTAWESWANCSFRSRVFMRTLCQR